MTTDRHGFAVAAVAFWSARLLHRRPTTMPWVTTSRREWLEAHDERLHGICTNGWRIHWLERQEIRASKGQSCRKCRGILVAIVGPYSLDDLWNTACHEVLHAGHPSWSEEKVEQEAARQTAETPRLAALRGGTQAFEV